MSATNTTGQQELVMERTFNAPRELVFNVWTQPEHLVNWWGPKGMSIEAHKFDLRKGGMFHYSIAVGNDTKMWGKLVFDRVEPHTNLDYISSFSDENGGTTVHPMSPSWPLELISHVVFTGNNGKTTLHMRAYPINASDAERQTFFENEKNVATGTKGMLDVLEEYLESVTNN